MRFSLRTLLIILTLEPPLMALGYTLFIALRDMPAQKWPSARQLLTAVEQSLDAGGPSASLTVWLVCVLLIGCYFVTLRTALCILPSEDRPPSSTVAVVFFLGLAILWFLRPLVI